MVQVQGLTCRILPSKMHTNRRLAQRNLQGTAQNIGLAMCCQAGMLSPRDTKDTQRHSLP